MFEIGDKYTLWLSEYSREAYVDQLGRSHPGYKIIEQVIVQVTRVRNDVRDMWTGEHIHRGILAVSIYSTALNIGEVFQNNWHTFPSDANDPYYYWDATTIRDGKRYQPVDAVKAYNNDYNMSFVLDNKRAVPIGLFEHINMCDKHAYLWYKWDKNGCFKCLIGE